MDHERRGSSAETSRGRFVTTRRPASPARNAGVTPGTDRAPGPRRPASAANTLPAMARSVLRRSAQPSSSAAKVASRPAHSGQGARPRARSDACTARIAPWPRPHRR